jgi:hypothetical protein
MLEFRRTHMLAHHFADGFSPFCGFHFLSPSAQLLLYANRKNQFH